MKTQLRLPLTRRDFLMKTATATTATALAGTSTLPGQGLTIPGSNRAPVSPIALFSKVCQTLKLSYEDSAALVTEAGMQGVDPPVRPDGEVLPERVADDLPKYAEALQKHNLRILLLTTAITSPSSANAEAILRTAKKLGVQYYRTGFTEQDKNAAPGKQIAEVKAGLKDLVAINKEIGITAIYQNHSPSGHSYLGGNLDDLYEIVKDFDPAQLGVAFDIGHALVVHGKDWRSHFEKLKSHFKIAYIKDVKIGGRWVEFGKGDIAETGYFKVLREMKYTAPISLHIEFDWTEKGKSKTRAALLKALQESTTTLKKWLAVA